MTQKPHIVFHYESEKIKVEMKTERLYIHSYRHEDFEDCILLYGDKNLTAFFDHGRPFSRAEVENLIQEKGTRYFHRGEPFGLFSIFDINNKTFIGQIDLIPANEPGTLEIGCIFHRQFQGVGLPLEAMKMFSRHYVQAMCANGFKCNEKPIQKIIATAHPNNFATQRLVKYLGGSFEKSQERFGQPRLWFSYTLPPSLPDSEI